MKAPLLAVEKIEFITVSVDSNLLFEGGYNAQLYQLNYNFKGNKFLRKVTLTYPEDSLEDPRQFVFSFRLKINGEDQDDGVVLPYDVEIEAAAFMFYKGDKHFGVERFKAMRATGYSLLYGAIREMVSNLTARGANGMWLLPAADFNQASSDEAELDYKAWNKKLSKKGLTPVLAPDISANSSLAKAKPRKKKIASKG
jgi:hypothetical protein